MPTYTSIIEQMPYGPGFLFVDRYEYINEKEACGYYRFRKEADFYAHHFPGYPITPGVILIECMAQIGLVGFGMHLLGDLKQFEEQSMSFVFTESKVQFFKKILPEEEVKVVSEKIYFRLGKLKCKVRMLNADNEQVAAGEMAGMLVSTKK